MATHRLSIFHTLTPDTSGNVWFEPAQITQSNERYPQMVLRFKDTSTKDTAGFRFAIPNNYSGGGVFEINWTGTNTTGQVVWGVEYNSAATTASLDPSTDDETLTSTSTAPGTSYNGVVATSTVTATLTQAEIMQGKLCRVGTNGSDNMAGDAVVFDVIFQYSD